MNKDTDGKKMNSIMFLRKILRDPEAKKLYKKIPGLHAVFTHRTNTKELTIDGREMIDFASQSYLGMEYHPDMLEAIGPINPARV